jgi:hypothetical protein
MQKNDIKNENIEDNNDSMKNLEILSRIHSLEKRNVRQSYILN